jgi:hypothetical protein
MINKTARRSRFPKWGPVEKGVAKSGVFNNSRHPFLYSLGMTRTWPPPADWFYRDTDEPDDVGIDGEPALRVSPDGRVSGTLPTGAQLGLRLLDGTAAARWAADEVRTAEGHTVRVGTIDVKDWVDERLVDVGVVAVCQVGYDEPDRVWVAGAVVPDAEDAAVAELAAGQVSVMIEPRWSDLPALTSLCVYRPTPAAAPAGLPPVRRVWS